MVEDQQYRVFQQEQTKLERDAEEEVNLFAGNSTEYLKWLGRSAAVLSSVSAMLRKLMDVAQSQDRPFTDPEKTEIEQLQLFSDAVMLTALAIEESGAAIGRSRPNTIERAAKISLEEFRMLLRKHVAAHRLGYRLWQGREAHRLTFSRPTSERLN